MNPPRDPTRFYTLPGEGIIVAIHDGNSTLLFSRQGLQHRIVERQRQGLDTAVEERALARINSFTGPCGQ